MECRVAMERAPGRACRGASRGKERCLQLIGAAPRPGQPSHGDLMLGWLPVMIISSCKMSKSFDNSQNSDSRFTKKLARSGPTTGTQEQKVATVESMHVVSPY